MLDCKDEAIQGVQANKMENELYRIFKQFGKGKEC